MHRLDPESLPEHLDALYRAARGLCRSPVDAEDLVQETVARLLDRPRWVRGEDRVYLMRALRNTFLNQRRAAARRPVGVELDEEAASERRGGFGPHEAAEVTEIYAAVGELAEEFRLALVAVDFVGLGYDEAAVALGTSRATIASRVHRARGRVAAALGNESARKVS